MNIVLGVLLLIAAVFLIVVVMLQEGKQGVTSAISGGSSDTYLGKSKGEGKKRLLSRVTMYVAIVFAVLVLVVYVIQDDAVTPDQAFNEIMASSTVPASNVAETVADAAEDAAAAVEDADINADADAEG